MGIGIGSVRARAVRQVRAGPVLGDQVLRRAGDRRHHPVPTLPERHRLVPETGRDGRGRAWRQCRRPAGVVQPTEKAEHGVRPGRPPPRLRSSRRHVVLISAADIEAAVLHHLFVATNLQGTAWVDHRMHRS